jgi:hypothetical protein
MCMHVQSSVSRLTSVEENMHSMQQEVDCFLWLTLNPISIVAYKHIAGQRP